MMRMFGVVLEVVELLIVVLVEEEEILGRELLHGTVKMLAEIIVRW
jgi:hypothetical protein